MEVAEFRGLSPRVWPTMHSEEWTSRLQRVCGHFQPEPCRERPVVTGLVETADAAGVELAHVANNLNVVRRSESDIRRDYGENIFLLIQLEGMCCSGAMRPAGVDRAGRLHLDGFRQSADFSFRGPIL